MRPEGEFFFDPKEREIDIELRVDAWAEQHGWLPRKTVYVGRKGCPDKHYYGHGKIVVIEYKRKDEEPNPQQDREHARLRAHGIEIPVIDTYEGGIAILKRAMRGTV